MVQGVCVAHVAAFPGYRYAGARDPGLGVQDIARFVFQLCHRLAV